MRWIDEPDKEDPRLMHQALLLEPNEPLGPAFIAFWKRILSDGFANAATSDWRSLSIEIRERQLVGGNQGCMRAAFRNAQRKPCAGTGDYVLRSDAFTCLEDPNDERKTAATKQCRWFLEQYRALKEATRAPELRPLFQQISGIRPLLVNAATGYGWFDLQVDQDSFGRLPAEDRAMLEEREPAPHELMEHLLPGGPEGMSALRELGAALVAYTPPNFETICCRITEGIEQGQRALFYDISCPQFPNDGTTEVNDRVHRAATQLVQQMAPAQGSLPGIVLRLELQKDGSWRHNMTLLTHEAA
jgi:hypothetical protein